MSLLPQTASRVGTRHIQVFIPSITRDGQPIPQGQEHWVEKCLAVMGEHFGGATAFPPARGVWRDDDNERELVFDETVIVFSYVSEDSMTEVAGEQLFHFIQQLGRDGMQGEVGVLVDGDYHGFQDFSSEKKGK